MTPMVTMVEQHQQVKMFAFQSLKCYVVVVGIYLLNAYNRLKKIRKNLLTSVRHSILIVTK